MLQCGSKNRMRNSYPEQKEKSAAFATIFIFTSTFLKTKQKIPKHTTKKRTFFLFCKMQAPRTQNTTCKSDLLCNTASFFNFFEEKSMFYSVPQNYNAQK